MCGYNKKHIEHLFHFVIIEHLFHFVIVVGFYQRLRVTFVLSLITENLGLKIRRNVTWEMILVVLHQVDI